jgi:hypothetical protein
MQWVTYEFFLVVYFELIITVTLHKWVLSVSDSACIPTTHQHQHQQRVRTKNRVEIKTLGCKESEAKKFAIKRPIAKHLLWYIPSRCCWLLGIAHTKLVILVLVIALTLAIYYLCVYVQFSVCMCTLISFIIRELKHLCKKYFLIQRTT